MNLELTEEFAGEFDELSSKQLRDRLEGAFTKLAMTVLKAKVSQEVEGQPGEIAALSALEDELQKGFAAELDRIQAELTAELSTRHND